MTGEVFSDRCRLEDLFIAVEIGDEPRTGLRQATGWVRSWHAEFRTSAGKSEIPVADLGGVVAGEISPVRAFTWSTRQRHRPGLQFMVSTGRHHGFESLEEQRLLLAVDFTGRARVVVSQPLRLRYDTADGHRSHVPDFLVFDAEGVCLFDVRPAQRIGESDSLAFAATAEAALSAGWGYRVVGGWRRGVVTALDALSAQRRDLPDPLGIQEELLRSVSVGASELGELVGCGADVGLRRAYLLHLLWRRRLGVDLAAPLGDGSLVWAAGAGR